MYKGLCVKEQLQKRLEELKSEFDSGQKMIAEFEKKRSDLEVTMLRISGAVQVIEEMLKQDQEEEPEPANIESE